MLRDRPRSSSRVARNSSVSSVSRRWVGGASAIAIVAVFAPVGPLLRLPAAVCRLPVGELASCGRAPRCARASHSSAISDFESSHSAIAASSRSSGHGTISIRSSSSGSAPASASARSGGQEQPHPLVAEAGAGVEGVQLLPAGGLLADLLGQLALGALPAAARPARRACRPGSPARPVRPGRLARLAGQPHVLVVDRQDRRPRPGCQTFSRVTTCAVGVAEVLDAGR